MNDSTAVAPPQDPNCARCGTAIEKGQTFCEFCADVANSVPRPMFNTAPQPEPPQPKLESLPVPR